MDWASASAPALIMTVLVFLVAGLSLAIGRRGPRRDTPTPRSPRGRSRSPATSSCSGRSCSSSPSASGGDTLGSRRRASRCAGSTRRSAPSLSSRPVDQSAGGRGGHAFALVLGIPVRWPSSVARSPARAWSRTLFLSPLDRPGTGPGLRALPAAHGRPCDLDSFGALLIGHTALLLPYAVRVTGPRSPWPTRRWRRPPEASAPHPCGRSSRSPCRCCARDRLAAALLSFVTSFNNVPLSLLLKGPAISGRCPSTMLDYVQPPTTRWSPPVRTLLLAATVGLAALDGAPRRIRQGLRRSIKQ